MLNLLTDEKDYSRSVHCLMAKAVFWGLCGKVEIQFWINNVGEVLWVSVGFLICQSAETASAKVLLTARANAPITSGKDTGTTNASWNFVKWKKLGR
jgi:hypothetical protein